MVKNNDLLKDKTEDVEQWLQRLAETGNSPTVRSGGGRFGRYWVWTFGMDLTSRNHMNILSSDVVVALPGGPRALSEVQLAKIYRNSTIALFGSEEEDRNEVGGLSTVADDLHCPIARTLDDVDSFLQEHLMGQLQTLSPGLGWAEVTG